MKKVVSKYFFVFIILIPFLIVFLYLKLNNTKTINNSQNNNDFKPTRNILLGFWTYGFWDDNSKSINPVKLQEIENKIGKKVVIANYFRGWEHLGNRREIVNELNTISESGWTPMVSTNPYFFSQCQSTTKTLYRAIADGDCDNYLHLIGKTLSQVRNTFFLRFAWEMNVGSMDWSIIKTGSKPYDFIAAWRRFYNILQENKATSAMWVFSPQIETGSTTPISELYPGDEYVDWVALDGYNWGTAKSWSKWQSFYSIYYNSYTKIRNLAPSKPLMIAEVNTTNVGGDQANWYKDMLGHAIPDLFPDIDAVVFFNEDKTKLEGVKWLIDNTPQSLEQFKTSIQNPIYTSHLE